jgi:hypothetical protein
MVLSYIIGDNALLRLALHVFIGVASDMQRFWYSIMSSGIKWSYRYTLILSESYPDCTRLLLGIWLLTKASPRFSRMGNPVMAYLVWVCAATHIGGAVLGTIFPQVSASANLFDVQTMEANTSIVSWFFTGVIILLGTVATLSYFHFGVKTSSDGVGVPHRHPLLESFLAPVGQVFIAITFGALFAGVLSASLAALIDRTQYM